MKVNHFILSIFFVLFGTVLFTLGNQNRLVEALANELDFDSSAMAGKKFYPYPFLGGFHFPGARLTSAASQNHRCGSAQAVTGSLTGEQAFTRLFSVDAEPDAGAGGVFPVADGYFVLNNHANKNGFVKFNQAGIPVLAKDYAGGAPYGNRYAVATSDGKYLLGGVKFSVPQVSGYLAKGNADTSIMWAKSISSPSIPNWIAGIASTVDNGVLALARDWGFGILKFDSSGNLMVKKRINLNSPTIFADIFAIYENYYYDDSDLMTKHCGGYILFGNIFLYV